MRILVLSFYYPPDLSAGSFRTGAFVRALRERLGPGDSVDVMTTLPNRYRSFTQDAPTEEEEDNLRVRRVQLPSHRSGMADQSKAFLHFAWPTLRHARRGRYDAVYATSSRLFTGFLGALAARHIGAPLYLDIRDIFTDTIADLLGGKVRLALPAFRAVEAFTVGTARRVNLVSEGFAEYFSTRYPKQSYSFFPNGIDEEFLSFEFRRHEPSGDGVRILYAGNVGEGQGLDRIVPEAARRLGDRATFVIVGDGGARAKLEHAVAAGGIRNVELLPPVPREQLLELYRDSDVLFLHLNDVDAFEKVLPSKIFEYSATGKPLLAGVKGFSRRFIERHVRNAAVFDPCDAAGFVGALGALTPGHTDRSGFVAEFSRTTIMERLACDFLAAVGRS